MTELTKLKGFLFDLDGTLHIEDKEIDGASELISLLKQKNIPCRFLTNTTTKSRSTLHNLLRKMNLPIEEKEILNTPQMALQYLRKLSNPSCYFLLNQEVMNEFKEFTINNINPEYIIVGDIGDAWDYSLMNKLFNMIMNGSRLIALHKGRFWQTKDGLKIDIGAFVTGLEYTTGKQAIVFGKPSKEFYMSALENLNIKAEEAVMVGDDIINDVQGAQEIGIFGILVKTGKYREHFVNSSGIKPDLIIDSVKDLFSILK